MSNDNDTYPFDPDVQLEETPGYLGHIFKEMMDDGKLAEIAHDLVSAIRTSVTIDWTQKEAVRANLRRKVKRLLRKHGYPPDKQAEALETVIEQAEVVCKDWSQAA